MSTIKLMRLLSYLRESNCLGSAIARSLVLFRSVQIGSDRFRSVQIGSDRFRSAIARSLVLFRSVLYTQVTSFAEETSSICDDGEDYDDDGSKFVTTIMLH